MAAFDIVDVLRLEVEVDPTGLRNINPNPSGDLGTWGWVTPAPGTKLNARLVGGVQALNFFATTGSSWFNSEPLRPVTAGTWVAASWVPAAATPGRYDVRLEWINADGVLFAATPMQGFLPPVAGVRKSITAFQAPSGTVACRLAFQLYDSAGNPPATGDQLAIREVTVATASTGAALANLGYVEPFTYLNILGPANDLKITRDELSTGILTATILDSTLDPAKAAKLRPGRRARAMALDPATGQWTPLLVGKVQNAKVDYDYKTPGLPASKRARISITITDNTSRLAATPRADGVVEITNLRYLLEGAGVPWFANGSAEQSYFVPDVVAHNPAASLLDQIAITRDTSRGYAWVDRRGVLQAWDADWISTTVAATLNEDVYGDLNIDYDTERCINTVNLRYLRMNLATGGTVEVPYGPYVDQASIDQWGPRSADFTIQGITETPTSMAAYANAVLAASSTPRVRINSVTIPIRNPADVGRALIDLYDLVKVINTDAGLADNLRVTGIEHHITTEEWLVTFRFAAAGGVAPPQSTPSPAPPVGGVSSVTSGPNVAAGVSVTICGNDVAILSCNISFTANVPAGAVLFTLPEGARPSRPQFCDLVDGAGEVPRRLRIDTNGVLTTDLALGALSQLRGQIVLPL